MGFFRGQERALRSARRGTVSVPLTTRGVSRGCERLHHLMETWKDAHACRRYAASIGSPASAWRERIDIGSRLARVVQ